MMKRIWLLVCILASEPILAAKLGSLETITLKG